MNRIQPLENECIQTISPLPTKCWFRFLSRMLRASGNLAASQICSSLFLKNKSVWIQPALSQERVFVPHSFLRNECQAGVVVSWGRNCKVPARLAGGLLEPMDFGCQAICSSSHFFPMGGMTHYFVKSVRECNLVLDIHSQLKYTHPRSKIHRKEAHGNDRPVHLNWKC